MRNPGKEPQEGRRSVTLQLFILAKGTAATAKAAFHDAKLLIIHSTLASTCE